MNADEKAVADLFPCNCGGFVRAPLKTHRPLCNLTLANKIAARIRAEASGERASLVDALKEARDFIHRQQCNDEAEPCDDPGECSSYCRKLSSVINAALAAKE